MISVVFKNRIEGVFWALRTHPTPFYKTFSEQKEMTEMQHYVCHCIYQVWNRVKARRHCAVPHPVYPMAHASMNMLSLLHGRGVSVKAVTGYMQWDTAVKSKSFFFHISYRHLQTRCAAWVSSVFYEASKSWEGNRHAKGNTLYLYWETCAMWGEHPFSAEVHVCFNIALIFICALICMLHCCCRTDIILS